MHFYRKNEGQSLRMCLTLTSFLCNIICFNVKFVPGDMFLKLGSTMGFDWLAARIGFPRHAMSSRISASHYSTGLLRGGNPTALFVMWSCSNPLFSIFHRRDLFRTFTDLRSYAIIL